MVENYDYAASGQINKIYVVICGRCDAKLSLVALDKTRAASGFKSEGWCRVRNYGDWLYCPSCIKEMRN